MYESANRCSTKDEPKLPPSLSKQRDAIICPRYSAKLLRTNSTELKSQYKNNLSRVDKKDKYRYNFLIVQGKKIEFRLKNLPLACRRLT